MRKIHCLLLGAVMTLCACMSTTPRHEGYAGNPYIVYSYSQPYYTDYYGKRIYRNPYADFDEVKNAVARQKDYEEGEQFYSAYNHTSYDFAFAKDSVKNGKPIQSHEYNAEKVIALRDHAKFVKTESFNDEVDFKGFKQSYAHEEEYLNNFEDVTHVISHFGSNGIFFSDEKRATASWTMPVPGSIVRIKSERLYEDAKYLTTLYFHEYYPQDERVITFKIPVWLNVEIVERNFAGYEITKTEELFEIGEKYEPKKEETKTSAAKGKDAKSKTVSKKTKEKAPATPEAPKYRYVTYKMKKVAPLGKENLFPGYSHNLPHLIVLCKSYDETAALKEFEEAEKARKAAEAKAKKDNKKKAKEVAAKPAKKKKTEKKEEEVKPKEPTNVPGLIADVDGLYKWSYEVISLTDNKLDSVRPLAQEITKDKKTDLEKVEAIFYWVQDHIRYVAFEDGIAAFKPDACQNVLNNKYGDCKGMANLTKSMLVSLGYDARLTWIGTKRLNYDYSIPSVATSNHMICTIFLGGKKYYLDATEKYIGMDDYAHRIQGRPVMIEDSTKYILDTIPNLPVERNVHSRTAQFVIGEDGLIKGAVKETIKGENKTRLMYQYHHTESQNKAEVIKAHVTDNDRNIGAIDISFTDIGDRKNDLVLQYKLAINHNIVKDRQKLLVKPEYIYELRNHENDTARLTNLAYGHKLNYVHDYTFEVPNGYKVRSVPANVTIDKPEYTFTITYTQQGNKLVYKKVLMLKTGFISRSNIREWNSDIEKLEAAYNNNYFILEK